MTGISRKIMPLALLDAWPCNYAQGVSGVQNLANKLDKCTDAYERGNLIRNFNNDQSQTYSARNESDGLTFFGETSKKEIAKWTCTNLPFNHDSHDSHDSGEHCTVPETKKDSKNETIKETQSSNLGKGKHTLSLESMLPTPGFVYDNNDTETEETENPPYDHDGNSMTESVASSESDDDNSISMVGDSDSKYHGEGESNPKNSISESDKEKTIIGVTPYSIDRENKLLSTNTYKKYCRYLGRHPAAFDSGKCIPATEAAEMQSAVGMYRKQLLRPKKGKYLSAITATHHLAAKTTQAVEKTKAEIVEEVGEKIQDIFNGTMEQPADMDDVQWRNRCLAISRLALGQANSAKQRIDAAKNAQWWIKNYPDEAERDEQLKKKRKLAEELHVEKNKEIQR